MNFSLTALEFERFKSLLARYVSTDEARAILQAITPSIDLAELETEHNLVSEAMAYLREHRVPFREVPFLTQAIEKLTVSGSCLEVTEIESVHVFLTHVESLRVLWKDETEAFPKLAQKAARLPDLRQLGKRLS